MATAEKELTRADEAPEKTRTLSVWRGDGQKGEEVAYEVPITPGMVVLDAIHWIQAHVAPDLACRWNCKAARCGSCSAEINGRPSLMCKTRLDLWQGEGAIHVRPMRTFPVIKDLVTDVSWNYEKAKEIPFFKPRTEAPFTMYQRDVARPQEFRRCIECFLCQDVCHVLRTHDLKESYSGPRFMIKIAEWEMHPMDAEDRVPYTRDEAGVGFCNITKCCQEVCPEEIHITDNAIIPMKERVADRYWDPVRRLIRGISGKKG